MKNEKITFVGIDSWNRPIFRSIDFPRNFFGATDILFSFEADEAEVLSKISVKDLTYFGNKFGCEPMGTAASGLVIIKTKPGGHGAEQPTSGVDGDLQRAALTPSPGAPCYGAGGNHMESRTIKRPLSNEKVYSEKDVVLYLEKFLKGSLCGDCFNGSPWGEKENERLYFALSEIDYGNFNVAP